MNQFCSSCARLFGLIAAIALVTGCVGNNNITSISPLPPITYTPLVHPGEYSISTVGVISPTSASTPAPAAIEPVWEIRAKWEPANQIRSVLVDQSGDLWTGGPAGIVHWDLKTNIPTVHAIRGESESTNVTSLSQAPNGVIWAGTFGSGLARFDGSNWQAFTAKDGLPGNYIISQTITSQDELWFTTQQGRHRGDQDWARSSHFLHFNGMNWIIEKGIAFDYLVALPDDSIVGVYNPPPVSGIYFNSQLGIFDGRSWNDLGVYPGEWVDAITVAPDGVIWFATDTTIYRYENHIWKEITPPWTGKDFPKVSSVAVSKNGVAWFAFSSRTVFDIDSCGDRSHSYEERGIYRYDGKTWTPFNADDGLVDNKICAITLDSSGNVWFGSFDKGVSRFDGHNWSSYVITP